MAIGERFRRSETEGGGDRVARIRGRRGTLPVVSGQCCECVS